MTTTATPIKTTKTSSKKAPTPIDPTDWLGDVADPKSTFVTRYVRVADGRVEATDLELLVTMPARRLRAAEPLLAPWGDMKRLLGVSPDGLDLALCVDRPPELSSYPSYVQHLAVLLRPIYKTHNNSLSYLTQPEREDVARFLRSLSESDSKALDTWAEVVDGSDFDKRDRQRLARLGGVLDAVGRAPVFTVNATSDDVAVVGLYSQDPQDWPDFSDTAGELCGVGELRGRDLVALLDMVLPAVCTDETRANLNFVCLEVDVERRHFD
jgi:hypothetical protein